MAALFYRDGHMPFVGTVSDCVAQIASDREVKIAGQASSYRGQVGADVVARAVWAPRP